MIFGLLLFKILLSGCINPPVHARNHSPSTDPNIPFKSSDWTAALTKANHFIAQLNLTEKAGIVTGTNSGPCIGNIAPIPRLRWDHSSSDWDKYLMYQRGLSLGNEFKNKGAHVALGPVAGPLGRHPLGGRNWEGFSPDPYLTGIAMNFTVNGIQDNGVQACSKHFIGNEQETQRSSTALENGTVIEAISSNIDDRTLHELYLWPFADAVKAGTASVMCSYNRVNQTYACQNSPLLNGILKDELGFQGYVMSDFFATHSGVDSINGGLDMNMPGPIDQASIPSGKSFFGDNIIQAVNNGSISVTRLDDMIQRIMLPYFLLGQEHNYPAVDPSAVYVLAATYGMRLSPEVPAVDVRAKHVDLIRDMGAAATVLLKNVNSTLPLRSVVDIGVFGNDAPDPTGGLMWQSDGSNAFDIGTLDVGGGSGSGRHTSIVSPLQAIKAKAQLTGARVQYITNNAVISANDFHSIYPTPDVCLVFLKTFATEGFDRVTFEADWNSTQIVENVAAFCSNTVVITHSGGINTMSWATNPNVTAILAAHYPGEQSGNSIIDILWGDSNPAGKLPYTIPFDEADYDVPIVNLSTVKSPDEWQSDFTDGQFIDYRLFDAKNITPLYEFGYGLSYTTFDLIKPLTVVELHQNTSEIPENSRSIEPGGNPDLWTQLLSVTTSVTNTGLVSGASIAQLYASLPQDSVPAGTPLKVLRGFEKVYLEPGDIVDVHFSLTRRDLSYWDTTSQNWHLPHGQITLFAGFSSRDIIHEALVEVL